MYMEQLMVVKVFFSNQDNITFLKPTQCIVAIIVVYVVSFHWVFNLLLEQLLEQRGGSKLT